MLLMGNIIALHRNNESNINVTQLQHNTSSVGNTQIISEIDKEQDDKENININEEITLDKIWKRYNNKKVIAFEFNSAILDSGSSCAVACRSANSAKNRYYNIIPYDNKRVILDGDSDYINASYIDGIDTPDAYIATQAPVTSAFADFWLMTFSQNTNTIIVLGKEVDNYKIKIDRYWPNPSEKPVQFGKINVVCEKVTNLSDFSIIIREFVLVHSDNPSKPHYVRQYQYFGWPDHSTPENTLAIRLLLKLAYCNNHLNKNFDGDEKRPPIIVHCSAGVGRTGTFCLVHMIYEKMLQLLNEKNQNQNQNKDEGEKQKFKFSLLKLLTKLRMQRAGMIQQPSQYAFCYEVVHDLSVELGLIPPVSSRNVEKTVVPKEFEFCQI